MEKTTQTAKENYQANLRNRAVELHNDLMKSKDARDDEIEMIYEVLKQAALESWKNGLQAGRNRASKQPTGSTKSA